MSCVARVAIVHYHLRLGGVTRVIENAIRALQPYDVELVILHGDADPCDILGAKSARIPGLEYGGRCDPVDLLARLKETAAGVLGSAPDAWHIHNHSLGKNLTVPGLVDLMATRGERLLLQIHDFPEDGRPANYRNLLAAFMRNTNASNLDALYPRADHVHYALLNSRDRDFVLASGSPEARTHLLPNPVAMGKAPPNSAPSKDPKRILYPTRAIRRKNLGEFLLWSIMAEPDQRFGITLAPDNPDARRIHDRWVEIATELKLPVDFNMAADTPFPELISQSTLLVTTSVAEGFGLAFLEPWLMGRPLTGRMLPEITGEFTENGIDLSDLYEAVAVPLDWVGREALRSQLAQAMDAYFEAHARPMPDAAVERALDAACRGDRVDFGRLSEPLQEIVLRKLRKSTDAAGCIQPALLPIAGAEHVSKNAKAIQDTYNLSAYGKRLFDIYALLAETSSGSTDHLSSERLLESFLQPERFNLLRT